MVNQLPRTGYLYPYLPLEVLYALGHVPVQLFPAGHDPADAEPYLHKNFCALLKTTLALFLAGENSSDLEGVVLADVCDGQRRLYDVWRTYVQVPVLALLDVPRRSGALGNEYAYQSLARCVAQLERAFGQALGSEALAGSIQIYNRQRELWQALRAAWMEGRVPTEKYYALRELRLTSDPVMANTQIEKALTADNSPADASRKPGLLLMGSLTVSRGLVDAITGSGRAQIVAEDSCNERMRACDEHRVNSPIQAHSSREEMLRALAIAYHDPPAPRSRDLPRRLGYLANLAETRGANGVICSYYKFCDLSLAEFPVVKRFFEQRRIRVLLLEDEGEATFSGQARTRLEAFLEMLEG